jgi:hypothetical protein
LDNLAVCTPSKGFFLKSIEDAFGLKISSKNTGNCGMIDKMDPQVLFLAVILPGLFGISLVVEGIWKVRHGRLGVVELILGNLFLVLAVVAFLLVLR